MKFYYFIAFALILLPFCLNGDCKSTFEVKSFLKLANFNQNSEKAALPLLQDEDIVEGGKIKKKFEKFVEKNIKHLNNRVIIKNNVGNEVNYEVVPTGEKLLNEQNVVFEKGRIKYNLKVLIPEENSITNPKVLEEELDTGYYSCQPSCNEGNNHKKPLSVLDQTDQTDEIDKNFKCLIKIRLNAKSNDFVILWLQPFDKSCKKGLEEAVKSNHISCSKNAKNEFEILLFDKTLGVEQPENKLVYDNNSRKAHLLEKENKWLFTDKTKTEYNYPKIKLSENNMLIIYRYSKLLSPAPNSNTLFRSFQILTRSNDDCLAEFMKLITYSACSLLTDKAGKTVYEFDNLYYAEKTYTDFSFYPIIKTIDLLAKGKLTETMLQKQSYYYYRFIEKHSSQIFKFQAELLGKDNTGYFIQRYYFEFFAFDCGSFLTQTLDKYIVNPFKKFSPSSYEIHLFSMIYEGEDINKISPDNIKISFGKLNLYNNILREENFRTGDIKYHLLDEIKITEYINDIQLVTVVLIGKGIERSRRFYFIKYKSFIKFHYNAPESNNHICLPSLVNVIKGKLDEKGNTNIKSKQKLYQLKSIIYGELNLGNNNLKYYFIRYFINGKEQQYDTMNSHIESQGILPEKNVVLNHKVLIECQKDKKTDYIVKLDDQINLRCLDKLTEELYMKQTCHLNNNIYFFVDKDSPSLTNIGFFRIKKEKRVKNIYIHYKTYKTPDETHSLYNAESIQTTNEFDLTQKVVFKTLGGLKTFYLRYDTQCHQQLIEIFKS
jgi:hypothetical protein